MTLKKVYLLLQRINMYLDINNQSTFVYLGKADCEYKFVKEFPSIIFIHGAQQDHSCWNQQIRWFAHHGFNAFAPDLPSHGLSQGEPLSTIHDMTKWLINLTQALGVSQIYLVGHSMGSLIAINAAIENPSLIKKMVLIGSALPMNVSDGLLSAAKDNESKAISMVNNFSHSLNAQLGRNTIPGMWMYGINQRLMERQKPSVFYTDLNACNLFVIEDSVLESIDIPTMIIAGTEDKMTSIKSSISLSKKLKKSHLSKIQGVGHALMAEAPNEILNRLISFFESMYS
jgi:pimeloyl-ACP methyl ester carboxylesterase